MEVPRAPQPELSAQGGARLPRALSCRRLKLASCARAPLRPGIAAAACIVGAVRCVFLVRALQRCGARMQRQSGWCGVSDRRDVLGQAQATLVGNPHGGSDVDGAPRGSVAGGHEHGAIRARASHAQLFPHAPDVRLWPVSPTREAGGCLRQERQVDAAPVSGGFGARSRCRAATVERWWRAPGVVAARHAAGGAFACGGGAL